MLSHRASISLSTSATIYLHVFGFAGGNLWHGENMLTPHRNAQNLSVESNLGLCGTSVLPKAVLNLKHRIKTPKMSLTGSDHLYLCCGIT